MGSGEVIEECLMGSPGQFFLQLCFRERHNRYSGYRSPRHRLPRNEAIMMINIAKRDRTPVGLDRQLRDPFVGVLFCGKCGGIMKRDLPNKKRDPTPWYRCNTRGCDCMIMKCEKVETALCDAMEEWLDDHIIRLETADRGGKGSSLETGSKESRYLPFTGRRNGHLDLSKPHEINIAIGG